MPRSAARSARRKRISIASTCSTRMLISNYLFNARVDARVDARIRSGLFAIVRHGISGGKNEGSRSNPPSSLRLYQIVWVRSYTIVPIRSYPIVPIRSYPIVCLMYAILRFYDVRTLLMGTYLQRTFPAACRTVQTRARKPSRRGSSRLLCYGCSLSTSSLCRRQSASRLKTLRRRLKN